MSHECPIQGCSTQIGDTKLMCCAHWSMVPLHLQHDVSRYWRQTNTSNVADRRLAFHNYRVARDAAIRHVNDALRPLTA